MPELKFEKVISCSSETAEYPASNLLIRKKWTCKNNDETQSAEVVLQLSTPAKITSINVGNELSAFVEVMVGSVTDGALTNLDKFQTILPAHSLMTPLESRSGDNKNRVKCFNHDDLVQDVAAKDGWDLIKVTCLQAFNKRDPFGLSFITVMGKIKKVEEDKPTQVIQPVVPKVVTPPKMIGRFRMREDSDDDEPKGTAIMSRLKRKTEDQPATSSLNTSTSKTLTQTSKNTKPLDRNRESLLYNVEDADPDRFYGTGRKIQAEKDRKQAEKRKADEAKKDEVAPPKRRTRDFNEFLSDKKNDSSSSTFTPTRVPTRPQTPDVKPKSKSPDRIRYTKDRSRPSQDLPNTSRSAEKVTKPKTPQNVTYKPFKQLLKGVKFVISGIQNPDRAELRSMAIEMGAYYIPDWDKSCTHLICAFKNTPKYREVQGKGKIVTKDWIIHCHEQRKRLSWRQFALDDAEKRKDDSEGEIWEEKPIAAKSNHSTTTVTSPKPSPNKHSNHSQGHSQGGQSAHDNEDILGLYDLGYDDPDTKVDDGQNGNDAIDDDPYSKSTDEDEPSQPTSQPVEGIFGGKRFFFHPSVKETDLIKLEHGVPDQGGKVITDLHKAHYIISQVPVSKDAGIKGEVLNPRWVFESIEMECLIPTKRYIVK